MTGENTATVAMSPGGPGRRLSERRGAVAALVVGALVLAIEMAVPLFGARWANDGLVIIAAAIAIHGLFSLYDLQHRSPQWYLLGLVVLTGFLGIAYASGLSEVSNAAGEQALRFSLGEAVGGGAGAWTQMTISGLAMGMLIFIMASGMTLTFGLMGVLNLGHSAFITIGAYILMTFAISGWGRELSGAESVMANVGLLLVVVLVALVVAGIVGLLFERLIVKPVYDNHLKQILVTVGGGIIITQLIIAIAGPNEVQLNQPATLSGSFVVGPVVVETFRLVSVAVGVFIFWGMLRVINHTKVGILIRAGVQSTEMVEALGYRIKMLFIAVFMAGSALAAVGGVFWGLYDTLIHPEIGGLRLFQIIIVIIIGGLGSITGCFFGALLLGLMTNYVGFLAPEVAEFSSIALMVAVLMWRPQGLIPVIRM
jgi:branched-chain amino acid transport system permease protein